MTGTRNSSGRVTGILVQATVQMSVGNLVFKDARKLLFKVYFKVLKKLGYYFYFLCYERDGVKMLRYFCNELYLLTYLFMFFKLLDSVTCI